MIINVVNNSNNLLPDYATPGSSGVDLQADFSRGFNDKFFHWAEFDEVSKKLLIFSGGRALIPINLHTGIPEGYEVQIRPRSGLALKHGVTVLNTPGTIDSDYRNSWGVIITNTGEGVFEISQGDRIAQAVLVKVEKIEWHVCENVNELGDTVRGLGGFGSTGV